MAVSNPFDFFLEPYADGFPSPYEASRSSANSRLTWSRFPAGPRSAEYLPAFGAIPLHTTNFSSASIRRLAGGITLSDPAGAGRAVARADARSRPRGPAAIRLAAVAVAAPPWLAARFVSGYLIQLDSRPEVAPMGHRAPSEDFADLHAWCEVYLPGRGLDRSGPHLGPARRRRATFPSPAPPNLERGPNQRGWWKKASSSSTHSMTRGPRLGVAPRNHALYREAVGRRLDAAWATRSMRTSRRSTCA